ncbi:MAG: hypothetical protein OEL83_14310 [Desulforhopalus sp.]|nr:hypothetical protein [Desulforhopalus sp.]
MVVLALVGAAFSVYLPQTSKSVRCWIAVAWTVLPPIWFWFEYTYLATDEQKNDKDFRERLKFSQDCASKVWIAVGGVFTASYFDLLEKFAK